MTAPEDLQCSYQCPEQPRLLTWEQALGLLGVDDIPMATSKAERVFVVVRLERLLRDSGAAWVHKHRVLILEQINEVIGF